MMQTCEPLFMSSRHVQNGFVNVYHDDCTGNCHETRAKANVFAKPDEPPIYRIKVTMKKVA